MHRGIGSNFISAHCHHAKYSSLFCHLFFANLCSIVSTKGGQPNLTQIYPTPRWCYCISGAHTTSCPGGAFSPGGLIRVRKQEGPRRCSQADATERCSTNTGQWPHISAHKVAPTQPCCITLHHLLDCTRTVLFSKSIHDREWEQMKAESCN